MIICPMTVSVMSPVVFCRRKSPLAVAGAKEDAMHSCPVQGCLLEMLLSVVPTLYESVSETQCSSRVSLLT